MAIKKIPQDNEYFSYHNANPKNARAGDCVIRAISGATGKTWYEVYDALSEIARNKCRTINEKLVFEAYLKELGWTKHKQPRNTDGTKLTVRELIECVWDGDAVVTVARHMTCIYAGRVHDTWDCSQKTVSNYWTKG